MNSNEKKPFFTICTEVSNREKTIERTMRSISMQNFFDYEYIIVDNASSDKSHEKISNYLQKDKNLNLKTTYIRLEEKLQDIASWNKPIEFAIGSYIVVCEGDDWFESNHLSLAHNFLTENHDIGMYVSLRADLHNFQGDNVLSEKFHGYINSSNALKELISFNFMPPPSNVIFKRELNGLCFNYDSENYVYAGEMSLYYKLLNNNLNVYVNSEALTVNRGFSGYKKNFFHIKDKYLSFDKWIQNGHYKSNEEIIRVKLFKSSLIGIFFPQLTRLCFEKDMFKHLINESRKIGLLNSIKIFISSFSILIVSKLKFFIRKIVN